MSKKSNYSLLYLRIEKLDVSMNELITFFREKCSICTHQRIAHDASRKCDGVMNKPCSSGCDKSNPE